MQPASGFPGPPWPTRGGPKSSTMELDRVVLVLLLTTLPVNFCAKGKLVTLKLLDHYCLRVREAGDLQRNRAAVGVADGGRRDGEGNYGMGIAPRKQRKRSGQPNITALCSHIYLICGSRSSPPNLRISSYDPI